jgi:formate hydrogenlyase transcriptional activator
VRRVCPFALNAKPPAPKFNAATGKNCVILTPGEELNVPRAELKRTATRSFASGAATFEQAERQVIIDALKAASGKISGRGGAAERLGLKRTTLQNKMRKLNISRAEYSG